MRRTHRGMSRTFAESAEPCGCLYFVKIIHKKKGILKVAFWNEKKQAIAPCQSHRFEIDIESKWVYSHIKLSSNFSYVLFQVITQFDMAANPL